VRKLAKGPEPFYDFKINVRKLVPPKATVNIAKPLRYATPEGTQYMWACRHVTKLLESTNSTILGGWCKDGEDN